MGWEMSTRSTSLIHHSTSGTGTNTRPVGYLDHSKILYDTGMPDPAHQLTLLLESPRHGRHARIIELEEDRVEKFGSTGQLITHGLAHSTIGPCSQTLIRVDLDGAETKLSGLSSCVASYSLFSHLCWTIGYVCTLLHAGLEATTWGRLRELFPNNDHVT